MILQETFKEDIDIPKILELRATHMVNIHKMCIACKSYDFQRVPLHLKFVWIDFQMGSHKELCAWGWLGEWVV